MSTESPPKKVCIFGCEGMLGRYVTQYFSEFPQEFTVQKFNRQQFSVDQDAAHLENVINPGTAVIINCVGLTNKIEASPEVFQKINADWPFALGQYGETHNCVVFQASTDCVFDGHKIFPQKYTEKDKPTPKDVYGASKHQGEIHPWLTVLRLSIIGRDDKHHRGFVEWLQSCETSGKAPGFNNHWWNGVTCLEWARIVASIIRKNLEWHGVAHITPPYIVTKYELAQHILKVTHWKIHLEKCAAQEPVNRVLDTVYPKLSKSLQILPLHTQLSDMVLWDRHHLG